MADEEKVKTAKRVDGSSSSGAALDKTDVALYAGAKVERRSRLGGSTGKG